MRSKTITIFFLLFLLNTDSPDFEGHGDAQAPLERGQGKDPGGYAGTGQPGQACRQVHNLQGEERQLKLLEQRVVADGQPHGAGCDPKVSHGQPGQGHGHGVLEPLLDEHDDVDEVGEHPDDADGLAQDGHVYYDDNVPDFFADQDAKFLLLLAVLFSSRRKAADELYRAVRACHGNSQ